MFTTTSKALLLVVSSLMAVWVGTVQAQGFPTRPITLVVPFSAGGPTDSIARILAERMGRSLGQPVIVEDTTGAGGTIGVGRVVRAAPDGYTLGIGHIGTHVVNGAIYVLPYDLMRDLEPVAMVADNPQIIVSRLGVPAKDLRELVAWVKANENKTSLATGGAGTPAHVSAVLFQKLVAAKPVIAHYRGAAPAMQDVIAGNADISFDQAASSLPMVRGGLVRAYAVTAKARLAAAPDIPTVDEAGLPGFYMTVWHGIWAPKATPKAVVDRLNVAVVETLSDPAVRKRLADLGQEIPAPDRQTPEALRAHQKAEIDKWWPVIKEAGIKVE